MMFIDAANDAAMYPVSRLRGITCAADATVLLQFDSSVNGTADGDADLVTLTVTSGKEKAVMAAIAKQLTAHVSGALIVCDDVTGNHCHGDVSSCTITLEAIA